jgi:parvulin-like peptidyl-prolyl isomerase
MRRIAILLAGFIVFAALGAGWSAPPPASGATVLPAARVNGEDISYDDYIATLEILQVTVVGKATDQQKSAGQKALESVVGSKLLVQLAAKEGVPVTDQQVEKRVQEMKSQNNLQVLLQGKRMTPQDLRRELRGQVAYVNLAMKYSAVSDSEIADYYYKNKSKFNLPVRVKVGAIVTPTKSKIDLADTKLKQGADFAEVVKELSDDPITKVEGGTLGWVWPNQEGVPGAVVNTAMALAAGRTSGPIFVQGQWVIIKALERKAPTPKPLEEVKDSIRETIAIDRAARKPEMQAKIREFRQASTIEIFVKRYGKDLAATIKESLEEGK